MMDVVNMNFVLVQHCVSPVVVSVPHDGLGKGELSSVFAVRGKGTQKHDVNVARLVDDLNRPWSVAKVVRFLLHRSIVECNAPAEGGIPNRAYADAAAAEFYDSFHDALGRVLATTVKRYGQAVLFDLHGFTKQPPCGEYDLILGTAHRTTCSGDTDKCFAEFFVQKGYRVYLPGPEPRGGERYCGGHIIRRHAGARVDAVQIEIARRFRTSEGEREGRELVAHLREFCELCIRTITDPTPLRR